MVISKITDIDFLKIVPMSISSSLLLLYNSPEEKNDFSFIYTASINI